MAVRQAHGHDAGLPLVDLIACAICSVLLMVFAALISRGGIEGTPTGFALVTYVWEFSQDGSGVDAELRLDNQLLLQARSGSFDSSLTGTGGSWSSAPDSVPAVNLFAEYPKPNVKTWEVRLLMRATGQVIANQEHWTFLGPVKPARVTVKLIDQTTEGQVIEKSMDLSNAVTTVVVVNVDLALIQLRESSK